MQQRPIFRALFLVGATEGVRGFVMVVTNVHMARALGEQRYGVIGFAQTIYLYAALLGNFGLDWVGSRLSAQHTDPQAAKVGTILATRFTTSCAALLAMLGFCALSGRPSEAKFAIAAFGPALLALPVLIDWYFYGAQNLRAFITGRMLGQAFLLISVLALVGAASPIELYPLLFGGSVAVQSGYFLFVFVRQHGRLRPRLPMGELRALLRSSGTFFLSLVGTQVLLNFSFLTLGFGRAQQSLGQYTAAQRLAFGVFAAFGVLLGQAFFPVLARQFAGRSAAVVRTMRVFWGFAVAGAAAVAAVGIGLSAPVMEWVYSASFRSASSVFAWLMASAALILVESPLVYAMMATQHERVVLARGAVAACLCIVLNVVLAPAYGAMGAALANLIAIAAGVVISAIGYAMLVRPRLRAARAADAAP